jgi:hypothetical protein
MSVSHYARVALAIKMAGWRNGVTAPALAEATGCPERTARQTLAALARDGVLVAEVPERKGKRLGDWRTTYFMVKAR